MSTLTLKPRLSEKAYGLSKTRRTYVFDVPSDANKAVVSEAVADQFKVTVIGVNLATIKGKAKRSARRRSKPVMGQRSDTKKAYVRLSEGNAIPIFDSIEKDAPDKESK